MSRGGAASAARGRPTDMRSGSTSRTAPGAVPRASRRGSSRRRRRHRHVRRERDQQGGLEQRGSSRRWPGRSRARRAAQGPRGRTRPPGSPGRSAGRARPCSSPHESRPARRARGARHLVRGLPLRVLQPVGRAGSPGVHRPPQRHRRAASSTAVRRDRLVPMRRIKESLRSRASTSRGRRRRTCRVSAATTGSRSRSFVRRRAGPLLRRGVARPLSEASARWPRGTTSAFLSPRYERQERFLEEFSSKIPTAVLREAVPSVSLLKAVDLVSPPPARWRGSGLSRHPSYSILRSAIGQAIYTLSRSGWRLRPVRGGASKIQVDPDKAQAARAPRRWPRRRARADDARIATTRTSRARGALRRVRAWS